jgi:hypothetical protein
VVLRDAWRRLIGSRSIDADRDLLDARLNAIWADEPLPSEAAERLRQLQREVEAEEVERRLETRLRLTRFLGVISILVALLFGFYLALNWGGGGSGGPPVTTSPPTTQVGETTVPLMPPPPTQPPVTLVDIDGDGKADFVARGDQLVAVPSSESRALWWKDWGLPILLAIIAVVGPVGAAVIALRSSEKKSSSSMSLPPEVLAFMRAGTGSASSTKQVEPGGERGPT